MRVVIQENYDKMCKWAADYIAAKIKSHKEGRPFVLGLPTGSSPISVYKEPVRKNQSGELSFANVVTFNMDEYLGLPHEHDQSYCYFMHDNFFNHLVDMRPENINILNGMTDDPEGECARYEEKIASHGGIDLFMGGIGVDRHITFNEPFTSLSSRTGVRNLASDTHIVNSRFFGNDPEAVPSQALSVGVGTVFDSKEVLVLINGHNTARALATTVEGGGSQKWTCSALEQHNCAIIACDEASCGELTVDTYKYFLDIRNLTPQETYNLLEIVEARVNSPKGSMIFCTQYNDEEWYGRIDPESAEGSPIFEAIMERIVHNAHNTLVGGRVSMRKRHGINADREGGDDAS